MLASVIGLMFVFIDSILLYMNRSAIANSFSKDELVINAIIELMGVGSLAHFAMVKHENIVEKKKKKEIA